MKKLFACVIALLLFGAPKCASASDSIRISPVILRVELAPGTNSEQKITVSNLTDSPLPVSLSVDGFDATDEEIGININSNTETSPLSNWLKIVDPEAIIPAKLSREFVAKITVPNEINLGGYYAMIFVTPIFPDSIAKSSSVIGTKVGVFALANIGVSSKDSQGEIVELATSRKFYQSGPMNINLRIKNTGLNFFSTQPVVTLKSIFKKDKKIELEEKTILPGKIRKWSNTLDVGSYYPLFYRLEVASSLDGGATIYGNTFVLGFPWALVVGVILSLAGLITGVVFRRRIKRAIYILVRK